MKNQDALSLDEAVVVRSSFMCFEGKLYKRMGTKLFCVENESTLIRKSIAIHQSLGHCSPASIRRQLAKSFWHPDLLLHAQEALRLCENCSFRLPQSVVGQTLNPLPPTTPFARWGLDFTGPLSILNQRLYLLNAIDYATSWAYSVPSAAVTSRDIVILLHQIFIAYGPPREVITDNVSQFLSFDVSSMLKAYRVDHRTTTPYHPRANGKCERFNGTIKQIITSTMRDNPTFDFQTVVTLSLSVYRNRPLSHAHSLYFLVYGCQPPQTPSDNVVYPVYTREPSTADDDEAAEFRLHELHDDEDGGLVLVRRQINSVRYADNDRVLTRGEKGTVSRVCNWRLGSLQESEAK